MIPERPGPKPSLPDVVGLVRAYYAKPTNGAGGCLHLVLDDGNVRRGHVEYCRHVAWEEGDEDGVELCDLLLRMSVSQRRRLVRSRY
jgi:hypothetical protein